MSICLSLEHEIICIVQCTASLQNIMFTHFLLTYTNIGLKHWDKLNIGMSMCGFYN